jgi:hypothetical protein
LTFICCNKSFIYYDHDESGRQAASHAIAKFYFQKLSSCLSKKKTVEFTVTIILLS